MSIKVQRCAKTRKGGKGCKRYKTAKVLRHAEKKGSDKNAFKGRTRGLYVATITATDKAGNRSKPKRLAFSIAQSR